MEASGRLDEVGFAAGDGASSSIADLLAEGQEGLYNA